MNSSIHWQKLPVPLARKKSMNLCPATLPLSMMPARSFLLTSNRSPPTWKTLLSRPVGRKAQPAGLDLRRSLWMTATPPPNQRNPEKRPPLRRLHRPEKPLTHEKYRNFPPLGGVYLLVRCLPETRTGYDGHLPEVL